ncbi:cell wall protein DAN4-like isoform X2 [Bradysia coprophila]|uniref:cell wall protein DAN4-like isoform X2 n=1 Tax=Bradysia coprophila TaxID=38358 RepID=UPI00187DAF4D|nr:cell wall protein DAN4-like isoform X2 [Bradysia coprophila]
MVKSFVFLVVFVSTHCLIQGIDQQSVGSSDAQYDGPATTTSTTTRTTTDGVTTTVGTTTSSLPIAELPSTTDDHQSVTEHPSTTEKGSSTENPPKTEHSLTIEHSSTTEAGSSTTEHQSKVEHTEHPSTTEKGSSTETLSTTLSTSTTSGDLTTPNAAPSISIISYSSEVRDSPPQPAVISIIVDSLPESTLKPESLAATALNAVSPPTVISIIVEPLPVTESSTKAESVSDSSNPSTTASPFTKVAADTSTKMSAVCPDNCYLDITGVYCNCYQPTETVPIPKVVF